MPLSEKEIEKNNATLKSYKSKLDKQYDIKGNDRVFGCGKTGSGKSTLMQYLLYPAKRLIVIDGKDSEDIQENWNTTNYTKSHLNDIKNEKEYRIRLVNNKEDIITVLNTVYAYNNKDSSNVIIYIDEVTATIEPQTKPPPIYIDLWTRGRSKKIGCWAATQRPTQIPLFMLSESEHFFIFRLSLLDDRKRVASMVGTKVLTPPIDEHGFYYYNLNGDKLTYYKRLSI